MVRAGKQMLVVKNLQINYNKKQLNVEWIRESLSGGNNGKIKQSL